jgi:hypothetical protein
VGKKSKTSSQSTAVSTPNVPSWLSQPYQQVTSQITGLLGQTPQSFQVPANANQTASWARAGAGSGATAPLQSLTGFNANAGQVTPGLLKDVDLTGYLNPHTQNVIDTSVNDMNRARQMAITGNSANATQAMGGNAFLSDRAGVADSETNRGFLDSVAALTAGLRSSGYDKAVSGAQFDIGNKMAADTGNRDATLSADLASAATRLNAANSLGANYRADTEAQAAAGDRERDIALASNPNLSSLQQIQSILAMLQGVPIDSFTGQKMEQSGSGKSSSSGFSVGFGKDGLSFGFG